jgi:hypothetical protein
MTRSIRTPEDERHCRALMTKCKKEKDKVKLLEVTEQEKGGIREESSNASQAALEKMPWAEWRASTDSYHAPST